MIAASFSADGSRIVTISTDATARIWDAATGKGLAELRHGASVLSADLHGDLLATGSFDKSARIWNLRLLLLHGDALITSACAQRLTAARRITPEDVRMAPLLSGRAGEDVCRGYE